MANAANATVILTESFRMNATKLLGNVIASQVHLAQTFVVKIFVQISSFVQVSLDVVAIVVTNRNTFYKTVNVAVS